VQYADLEQRTNALTKPDRCPLTVEGGRCKGTNLQLEKDGSVHTDYQEIKIQEAGM
jgi:DNA replicative helicase MCM subunit Mcm2 (Cdc46/Mcm family)